MVASTLVCCLWVVLLFAACILEECATTMLVATAAHDSVIRPSASCLPLPSHSFFLCGNHTWLWPILARLLVSKPGAKLNLCWNITRLVRLGLVGRWQLQKPVKTRVRVHLCVHLCACVCPYVRVSVCARVCSHVHMCMCMCSCAITLTASALRQRASRGDAGFRRRKCPSQAHAGTAENTGTGQQRWGKRSVRSRVGT